MKNAPRRGTSRTDRILREIYSLAWKTIASDSRRRISRNRLETMIPTTVVPLETSSFESLFTYASSFSIHRSFVVSKHPVPFFLLKPNRQIPGSSNQLEQHGQMHVTGSLHESFLANDFFPRILACCRAAPRRAALHRAALPRSAAR